MHATTRSIIINYPNNLIKSIYFSEVKKYSLGTSTIVLRLKFNSILDLSRPTIPFKEHERITFSYDCNLHIVYSSFVYYSIINDEEKKKKY